MTLPKTPSEISDDWLEAWADCFRKRYDLAKNSVHIPGYTTTYTTTQFIKRFAKRFARNKAEQDALECVCWNVVWQE